MLLLSWHGTILRVEQTNRRLTHAPPVPVRAIAFDFQVDLPTPHTGPAPLPGEMEAIPGTRPGTVHLRRAGAYLTVEPHAPFPGCDRAEPGEPETLLPLTEAQAETLRRLLAGAWRLAHNDRDVPPGLLRLAENFQLMLGDHALDLTTERPEAREDGAVVLHLPAGRVTLVPAPPAPQSEAPQPEEWLLCPASAEHRAKDVATAEAWRATPDTSLTLPSEPERAFLPITARRADSDWLYEAPWAGHTPAFGLHHLQSRIVHESDKYVLLERFVEGIIFGPHGVTNEHGYLGNLTGAMPPNLAREAEQIFIRTEAVRRAPRLHGPHVVFYGGNLTNYFHWVIDAMLPLSLLQPHLPPDATLLLPGTLAQFRANPNGKFDHIEALEAFGFGDMKRVEVADQICHVENVYWADKCFIQQASAGDLAACRNRALNRLPPPGPADRKIYIKRTTTRRVANEDEVETFVRGAGFEIHVMENLTTAEQIELFRHAAFVIAVHGAAMANLMFCPPGTKIIEIAPNDNYRPFFTLISSKLGLTHAIMPCPTQTGGFFSHVQVDMGRLRALRRMLDKRHAG